LEFYEVYKKDSAAGWILVSRRRIYNLKFQNVTYGDKHDERYTNKQLDLNADTQGTFPPHTNEQKTNKHFLRFELAFMSSTFEYVIVGGGLVGCVLASRLSQAGHTVALLEAGPENYSPQIMSPVAAPHLHDTPVSWNYRCTPQRGLNNRTVPQYGGKVLSGSSAVNYGLWTRGHATDYDCWAEKVGMTAGAISAC
jgi:hypothetical protein